MKLVLVLATLALTLSACGGSKTPPSCLPGCGGSRDYDARQYHLRGSFDWGTSKLLASEDIALALPAGASKVVELDSQVKVSRVFAGKDALTFAAGETTLRVDLTPAPSVEGLVTFTVEYEASVSRALVAGGPRDDDPLPSKVVYTNSEPFFTPLWLVVNAIPADRARWSVELTVAEDHDVIANGARVKDERANGTRVVGYALDKPLPPYLMAFAAGALVNQDRIGGRVPLSVWHRRGLPIDPAQTLNLVADAMATFERLMIPYPWDSYSVVLLPQFSGGMENATITFNAESSGFGAGSFYLNAHELAHQWFGDWVTMHGYEDVWVKEGMATLLASEADRARRDGERKGRLFGSDFVFDPADSIVDRNLLGLEKYTSGVYERAAWAITQIRARIGEAAFWRGVRRVLTEHALGTIDGESFVRSFAPDLDEATIARVIAALPSHQVPHIAASQSGGEVWLSLFDPGQVLIAPVTLSVVSASAAPAAVSLSEGSATPVTVPADGYLALDERDVHPSWYDSFTVTNFGLVGAQLVPQSAAALPLFGARSAAHQETALNVVGIPQGLLPQVGTIYAELDSTEARLSAVVSACRQLTPGASLEAVIAPWLRNPERSAYTTSYAACPPETVNRVLGPELTAMVDALGSADTARLQYLLAFDYGDRSFELVTKVARDATSLRVKELALGRLVSQTGSGGYTRIPAAQMESWKAFFRERLTATTSQTRLRLLWRAVVALGDRSALPLVAPMLHSVPLSASVQRQIVCDTAALTAGSTVDWTAFQTATQPWETLAADASAALANPARCSQRRQAAELEDDPSLELGASAKTAREGRPQRF